MDAWNMKFPWNGRICQGKLLVLGSILLGQLQDDERMTKIPSMVELSYWVTTRIIPFLVWNPYRPSFVTVTSESIIHQVVLIFLGHFFSVAFTIECRKSSHWAKNLRRPFGGGVRFFPYIQDVSCYGLSNDFFLNPAFGNFGTWNVLLVMFRMRQVVQIAFSKSLVKTKSHHRCQHLRCWPLWFWEGIFAAPKRRNVKENKQMCQRDSFLKCQDGFKLDGVLNVC